MTTLIWLVKLPFVPNAFSLSDLVNHAQQLDQQSDVLSQLSFGIRIDHSIPSIFCSTDSNKAIASIQSPAAIELAALAHGVDSEFCRLLLALLLGPLKYHRS